MFRSVIFFVSCTMTSLTSFCAGACAISAHPSRETLMKILREETFNDMVGSREQSIKIVGSESCKTKELVVYQWESIVEVVKL